VVILKPAGLAGSPYQGYLYAYPHKTAYRSLRPRPSLRDIWADEPRDALFLYLHLPFCEMRCGFCNLFTRANPPAEQVRGYLRQLRRQAHEVRAGIGGAHFATGAVGGGTPTYLEADELTELFDIVDETTGAPGAVPLSVETSPATATPDRLAVVAARGAWRASLGVQSFLDAEAHAAGRPQRRSDVDRALAAIRAAGVPVLNIDLMYGIAGQTAQTWDASLRAALTWQPEEIYLYPLYVRPLTGLGRRAHTTNQAWDEQRMTLYRRGRDTLRAAGYRQLSMRHFRRDGVTVPHGGPNYCCQDDGMVGLGCGARSYTRDLHYSFDYAVSVGGVRAVIDDYLSRPAGDFAYAEVGFALDEQERRRRWLVKTLLRSDGVDRAAWRARFGGDVAAHVPPLVHLRQRGWLTEDDATIKLTEQGLAHSDAVGPWLVSDAVHRAMGEYQLK
jgi:coproporphyrinogen III oxidase-like Fe-S oxidoreductase